MLGAERGPRSPLRLRTPRASACATRTPPLGSRAFGCERFFVELQRPYERGDARRTARCATSPGTSASRRSPPATCTPTSQRRCCRTCSSPSAAAPRSTAASASGAATARASCVAPDELVERFARRPRRRRAHGRARGAARVRPHPGARLPVPRLLGRGPSRRSGQLAQVCLRAFDDAMRLRSPKPLHWSARGQAEATRGARPSRRGARADRGAELSGFFLLHWEVLELAREVARGARARLAAPAPAAGTGARQLGRLDRLLPDRPLPRRPRARTTSPSAASSTGSSASCRTSTSTSRATSARS